MNLNTYDEMIEVVRAKKAGKRVEVYYPDSGDWCVSYCHPEFQSFTYRVAREPVRAWAAVSNSGRVHVCRDKDHAERAAFQIDGGRAIELVEVQK